MRRADDSPFAARMMEKPISPSLSTTANDRHFYDPPELIQMAFGGRPWFIDQGCRMVHRIGLFKGVGWEYSAEDAKSRADGITGVRVTIGFNGTYTMEFLSRDIAYDGAGFIIDSTTKINSFRAGLAIGQLKPTYERMWA